MGELEDLRRENEKLRFMVDTAIRTCNAWAEQGGEGEEQHIVKGCGVSLLRHLQAIEHGGGATDVARKP